MLLNPTHTASPHDCETISRTEHRRALSISAFLCMRVGMSDLAPPERGRVFWPAGSSRRAFLQVSSLYSHSVCEHVLAICTLLVVFSVTHYPVVHFSTRARTPSSTATTLSSFVRLHARLVYTMQHPTQLVHHAHIPSMSVQSDRRRDQREADDAIDDLSDCAESAASPRRSDFLSSFYFYLAFGISRSSSRERHEHVLTIQSSSFFLNVRQDQSKIKRGHR